MSDSVLSEQLGGRALMLYDGLCGLCNGAVRWVAQCDHADRFRFAPQQSALAAAILSRHGIDQEAMLASNSVYLLLDAGSARRKAVNPIRRNREHAVAVARALASIRIFAAGGTLRLYAMLPIGCLHATAID